MDGLAKLKRDTGALRTGNSVQVSGKFAEVATPGSRYIITTELGRVERQAREEKTHILQGSIKKQER